MADIIKIDKRNIDIELLTTQEFLIYKNYIENINIKRAIENLERAMRTMRLKR